MGNLSIEELKELRTFKMDLADWVKFPGLKVEFNEEATNEMNAGYARMVMHIKPMNVNSPSKLDYIFVEVYDMTYSDFKGKIALRHIDNFVRAHFIDLEYKEGVANQNHRESLKQKYAKILLEINVVIEKSFKKFRLNKDYGQ